MKLSFKRFILFILFGPISTALAENIVLAKEPVLVESSGCMQSHIRDALTLNLKRREVYSVMTNSESRALSNRLIFAEKFALLWAKHYDREAKPFQDVGIPLFCDEFVPIKAREIGPEKEIKSVTFTVPFERKNLIKDFGLLVKDMDWKALETKSNEFLQLISDQSGSHCMIRHLLESIRRSAGLAPGYLKRAMEVWGDNSKEVKHLKKLLRGFNRNQISGFMLGYQIDEEAFIFQKQRIGILCNELPDIPRIEPK